MGGEYKCGSVSHPPNQGTTRGSELERFQPCWGGKRRPLRSAKGGEEIGFSSRSEWGGPQEKQEAQGGTVLSKKDNLGEKQKVLEQ